MAEFSYAGCAIAAALCAWLRPFPELTVHLLVYNCLPGVPLPFATSPRFDVWYAALSAAGAHVRRANRWRIQTDGGCGTLYVRHAAQLATDAAHVLG